METELLELFQTAKKAADAAAAADDGSADEIRCVDALRLLKSFPVTAKILIDTQVGKAMQHLKKHPRKTIQTHAVDVVTLWKNVIIKEANRNKNRKPDSKHDHKGDAKKKPAVMVKSDSDSVLTQDPRSPVSVSSKPLKATKEAPRDNIRKLIWEGLSKVYGEADEGIRNEVKACDALCVATSVESALFAQLGCSTTTGPSKAKYRSIVFNFKDQKNPDFHRKVLLGEVKAESVPSLTAEEMASDTRKLEIEMIRNKALLECERSKTDEASTDQFKCGRCGQNKCNYHQQQTRSADEPMTTYVVCVNCDKRWKF